MDLRAQRELYNGFGNTLARAIELVVTPLVFLGLGRLLDGSLDTSPVFTAGLAAFAVVGMAVRMYYRYVGEMEAHEARLPGRPGASP